MARARNIKPAFFMNDELAELSMSARLLFIGLWTITDYKGDLEYKPKRIKAQLFPYDDVDVEEIAINLDNSGFIRFYSNAGKIYINITNFLKHQNPHKNERDKGSEIPSITDEGSQVSDFKGITINRDLSRGLPEDSTSDRADSLNLIPDSLNLIPDSLNRESGDSTSETSSSKKSKSDKEKKFHEFYEIYPHHVSKAQALKAWMKVNPDLYDKIMSHVQQRNVLEWHPMLEAKEKKFIPHPSTFLNQERWNDEIEDKRGNQHASIGTNQQSKLSTADRNNAAAAAYIASLEGDEAHDGEFLANHG